MPTGYTANVKDGISFEQFALQCSRAMGALVMMRDAPFNEPIPDAFEPSTYHPEKLKAANEELARLMALTDDQIEEECDTEYRNNNADKEQRLLENIATLSAYKNMLEKARGWNPPTEAHKGLKKFMVEQLESSIDFDDSRRYLRPEKKKAPDKWFLDKLEKLDSEIRYHSKEYQKEIELVNSRNAWISALRDSLKNSNG